MSDCKLCRTVNAPKYGPGHHVVHHSISFPLMYINWVDRPQTETGTTNLPSPRFRPIRTKEFLAAEYLDVDTDRLKEYVIDCMNE